MNFVDLRSDTVTLPTPEMREAMYRAEVGDDVYGDDPTVRRLEEYAAEVVGKEAALFVPSGTFGNQLSLFTHCSRGDEVILGDDCHIVEHEVGASSVIAGVQLRTLRSKKGELDAAEIECRIRDNDIHSPRTGLICLENAHSNGRVVGLEVMSDIFSLSRRYNIPVHLDGARLFNAAAYLCIDPKEITKYCDSVMFCLSKGLCAPVGSILAGSNNFIKKARKGRKLMGGGMRQAGVIAAAGIVALEKMRQRLKVDHDNAAALAMELSKIPGIRIDTEDVHINMVFADFSAFGSKAGQMAEKLNSRGIRVNPANNGVIRFVTNFYVDRESVLYTARCIEEILAE